MSTTQIRVRRAAPGVKTVSELVAERDVPPAQDEPRHHPPHIESKATYALEQVAPGTRATRKSTRKAANHAKPDTNFNLREQLQKGSPEARFRRASAAVTRVRGGSR